MIHPIHWHFKLTHYYYRVQVPIANCRFLFLQTQLAIDRQSGSHRLPRGDDLISLDAVTLVQGFRI